MLRRQALFPAVIALFAIAGCGFFGSGGPKPKGQVPVFPISGTIKIDGEPAPGVVLYIFSAEKVPDTLVDPSEHSIPHICATGADGKFSPTTYYANDGLPKGSYAVALMWPGKNPPAPKMAFGPAAEEVQIDPTARAFNRKYGNPTAAKLSFSVEGGKQPQEIGVWELQSK